jgi:hypothetical protein
MKITENLGDIDSVWENITDEVIDHNIIDLLR